MADHTGRAARLSATLRARGLEQVRAQRRVRELRARYGVRDTVIVQPESEDTQQND